MTAPRYAAEVIRQGEDVKISAKNLRSVETGELMDVSGWPARALARAWYARVQLGQRIWQYRMMNPVMTEWSTTPTGTQGRITAGVGSDNDDPNRVVIHVTADQTYNWRSPLVLIQAFLHNPVTGETAKIISRVFEIEFGTIPDDLKF